MDRLRPEGIIMTISFDLLHNLSYRIPLCGFCFYFHTTDTENLFYRDSLLI